jgi:hypothetical protein
MDGCGQQLFDQTSHGLDHFAMRMLDKSDRGRQRSRRLLLAPGEKLNTLSFCQELCYCIVILSSVSIKDRSRWHIKSGILQRIDIPKAAGREKKLHRRSGCGEQYMDFPPRAIPLLAGQIPARRLFRSARGACNPPVSTDRQGPAVNNRDRRIVALLPHGASQMAQEETGLLQTMPAPTTVTLAHHLRHIPVWLAHYACPRQRAAKA